ncbi:hypothetical protein AAKU61_002150 [Undibacterium sp. GrIS 1.2]|uniref:hypothetical protein n=1 Tax=Undibacterium sp. GrIS 1.2 TaxID=3143933 RepID=UPI00339179E9
MIQHYQQIAQSLNWDADYIDKNSPFNDGELIAAQQPTFTDSTDLRLSITEEKMSRFAVIASSLVDPQLRHFNSLVPALVPTLAPTLVPKSNSSANTQIGQHDFETKRFKPNHFFLS